jgi:SHS2 domain-containing protein
MPYEVLEHTADIRLKISGDTFGELLSEGLRGIMSLLRGEDAETEEGIIKRNLVVSAPDRAALLVEFLNKALSFSHVHKEIYSKVIFRELSETSARADIYGARTEKFGADIKAVSYHDAEVKEGKNGRLEVMLVLDI